MNEENALQKVITWGKVNDCVDALMVTGSLAGNGKTDVLSDIDIAVFGNDFTFIQNDDWLSDIGNTWVCIHDQFYFEEYIIPTRLAIFNNGLKIDFSFHPTGILKDLANRKKLPDAYKNGYRVLLDKTGLTNNLEQPDYKAFFLLKPDMKTFQDNENEFWFECYHVAKYLQRNDLWTAKVRDSDAKKFVLKMLEWHHIARHATDFNPKLYGREMQNWLDRSLWNKLYDCYSGFDKESSWRALNNTIELYRSVAKETAAHFFFEYNDKLDNNMSSFIVKLQQA